MAQKLKNGKFIAFEGGEGAGKSTQIRALETYLQSQGYEVLVTWEPGGTPLGEKIRSLLLDPESSPMDFRCEALLYAAARAQHASQVIKPALKRGSIVLCDRYLDASKAYQGAGRELGTKVIEEISLWAIENLLPDRTYVFENDPAAGLHRVYERSAGKLDRLEQEPLDFHTRIRNAYVHFAKINSKTYKLIHVAHKSIEEIRSEITKDIDSWMNQ